MPAPIQKLMLSSLVRTVTTWFCCALPPLTAEKMLLTFVTSPLVTTAVMSSSSDDAAWKHMHSVLNTALQGKSDVHQSTGSRKAASTGKL